jgi:hypothetical protein
MSVSPYEIAVKITMQNAVSGVFAVIARDALRLEGGVSRLTKMFSSLNTTSVAAGGALAALGGAGIIGGLMNVANHGQKLLDQQDKLQRAGISYNEVLKMQADYYNRIAKSVPTSTAAEYLKTVNELRAVTGSTAEAAKLAPKAIMLDTLLGNSMGTKHSGEFYKLLRSAEMKGISTDEAKRDAFTEEAYKYIAAFGGKLTANDFQLIARRGGTAWMNAKPEALGPIAVTAADLGGSGAGTTLMTLQQLQMGASTLSKQQGEALEQLGLLDMSKVTRTGFGGGRLQVGAGGVKGSLEHMGDLPGWIRDVVYPAVTAAAGGNEALAQALISKLSPNRNAAKLIEMFGNPRFLDQQLKDLGLAGMQHPVNQAYQDYISRNPEGVKKAFGEQYESMMQAIGAPVMQAAIPVMKGVTDLFTNIGAWANAHPEGIKLAAEAAAGVGALMIVLGGAAVVGAAAYLIPGGIVVVAATGIATIIGTLAALNWEKVSGGLEWFGKAMSTLGGIGLDAIAAGIKGIGDGLAWLKSKIGELLGYLGVGGADTGSHEPASSVFGRMRGMSGGAVHGLTDSPGIKLSDTGGMKSYFKDPLEKMIADAHAQGHDLHIVSGYRSHAHQAALFARSNGSGHWVARPGHSHHEMGIAADLKGDLGWAHAHAGEYGLHFPMPWENWHIEPQGSRGRGRHVPGFTKKHNSDRTEINVFVGNEKVAAHVTKRIVSASTHPTTGPYFDSSRHWSPPDMGIVGV